MPTRFDHAVIAVRDLDAALRRFQHLGFDARPGGRHTGRGTHNGLIRFGLDYVELLSVYDEAEARASGSGSTILDALNGHEAALAAYALATTNIEEDARRFRGTGSNRPYLNAMSRLRPDGQQLSWRILSPDASPWRRPWPFLIQWDTPDEQRLQIDRPGIHPNGATGWAHVAVATYDLTATLDVYQNQLGLELLKKDIVADQAARRAILNTGRGIVELLAPEDEGPVQQVLAEQGEGPFALSFTVENLEQTRAFLAQRDIKFNEQNRTLVIAPSETLGVQISLVKDVPHA